MFKVSALSLALMAVAGSAFAEQAPESKFEISGSYFRPKMELKASGTATVTDGTQTEVVSGSEGFDDRFKGGMLDFTWRPATRHTVNGSWYRIKGDQSWNGADAGTIDTSPAEDPSLPPFVDYDVAGTAKLKTKFELYNINYGYDFYRNDTTSITGLIGAYGARIRMDGRVSAAGIVDGEQYAYDERASLFSKTAYAPGLGLQAKWRPQNSPWDVRAGVKGFKTEWGDFDLDGHFIHANVQVGYAFKPNWTAFVGYDWFELKLKDDYNASGTLDGVAYTGRADATGRLRVHGPAAGVRLSF